MFGAPTYQELCRELRIPQLVVQTSETLIIH